MQFCFDDYTLDIDSRELSRGTTPIAVEPQVFDLLHHLVQHPDRVVSRHDLIATIWGDRSVSDSTVASRINAARKAGGDSGQAQRLIRTLVRRGIRFVGEVRTSSTVDEPGQPAVSQQTTPPVGAPRPEVEPSHRAVPPPDRPAIAVLPFLNMSGEPEQDYFSDGISEDMITALSRLEISIIGGCEFIGRNYDAAMCAAREAIRLRADYAVAYRVLIAAAAMAGEIDVARAALHELRRVQPNISLAWLASHMMPHAPDAEREHYMEAFRVAGLD